MIKRQKLILALAMITVFIALSVSLSGLVGAGDLEPPAAPDDGASAMYTIEDLYNYLNTGVGGAKRTTGFTEPVSGPGPTGRTLDEVHAKITEKCITCEGTLNGTRWCDQGDGTVKDMTTGLVWLKDASWGGLYPMWTETIDGINAHDRAAQIKDGTPSDLSDGSVEGDWRLPTYREVNWLIDGPERIHCDAPRAFTGLQCAYPPFPVYDYPIAWYWTSFEYWDDRGENALAFQVVEDFIPIFLQRKVNLCNVWPVRSDN